MANRSFHRILGGLEIDIVQLYVKFTVGAAGAATMVSAPGSKGVASVAKTATAGQYAITLQDGYQALLWASAVVLDATLSDPTAVGVAVKVLSETVSTPAVPGVVTIQFYETGSATAVDPRNGATVLVTLDLRNSSVI